jgi:hypothetical protein
MPTKASWRLLQDANHTKYGMSHPHLLLQYARQHKPASRPAVGCQPRLQLQQRAPQYVGHDHVKLLGGCRHLCRGCGRVCEAQE